MPLRGTDLRALGLAALLVCAGCGIKAPPRPPVSPGAARAPVTTGSTEGGDVGADGSDTDAEGFDSDADGSDTDADGAEGFDTDPDPEAR